MLFINIRNKALCQPDFIAAGFQALQVMDGSVTLVDAHLIKTGGLKLTVNIAGENAVALAHSCAPVIQDRKSLISCVLRYNARRRR